MRGLSRFECLKTLWAASVNQDMLEEIACLPNLEVLWIKSLSASSLECLGNNGKLRRLIVHGGSKVPDMGWVRRLSPTVEVLHLESLFRATDIDPIGEMTGLKTLGLEGGMSKKLELESLAPLRTLKHLQYLFLAATRIKDGSLEPLRDLTELRHLTIAANVPDREFISLRKALPGLDCDWFRTIEKYGSVRAGMDAFRRR